MERFGAILHSFGHLLPFLTTLIRSRNQGRNFWPTEMRIQIPTKLLRPLIFFACLSHEHIYVLGPSEWSWVARRKTVQH